MLVCSVFRTLDDISEVQEKISSMLSTYKATTVPEDIFETLRFADRCLSGYKLLMEGLKNDIDSMEVAIKVERSK